MSDNTRRVVFRLDPRKSIITRAGYNNENWKLFYLVGHTSAFALKGDWGDEALDLWSNLLGLLALLLDGTADDVLGDWVGLLQREELADVVGSLWTESAWDLLVGKTLDFALTLLDDGQVEDGQIVVDNAATDGLAFALTGTAWVVARVTLLQKKFDTVVDEDT